jgi:predicted Zn-dependent protease
MTHAVHPKHIGFALAGLALLVLAGCQSAPTTKSGAVGVELAARAGYDPRAAISLWRKMRRRGESQPPQFLSTHPSYDTRLADLQVSAARVMPLYERARHGG